MRIALFDAWRRRDQLQRRNRRDNRRARRLGRHQHLARHIENRARRLQAIAQRRQAFLGDIEDQVALAGMIFGNPLEVVFDAGDGIGQGIQALPAGHRLTHQQLLADVAAAGVQQRRRAGQRDDAETAAHLGQQLRHAGQMLVVPLRADELDDRVLGLLEPVARFLDHQLVDLPHVGGRQQVVFRPLAFRRTDHAGQGRLDEQQGPGDIHQHRVIGLLLPADQVTDHVQLIGNHLALRAEAEHAQGVGNLLERRLQDAEVGQLAAIAAHEQVQAVLDPHQLLAQGTDHRAHGVAIGAGHAGPLLVHHPAVGHRLGQLEARLQFGNAAVLARTLGHVEQQVLQQLVGGRLIERGNALVDQALELAVDLAQQGAHRVAGRDAVTAQALDHAGGHRPQGGDRRSGAQAFQLGEHLGQVGQLGCRLLVAHVADQRHLQHLPQLAQQRRQTGAFQTLEGGLWQSRRAYRQVGGEQAGFRQQTFAARGTQVIEQRQHHQRQIAARALDPLEIDRQLQDRLHQHRQAIALGAGASFDQRLEQLLHFFGQQGGAVELDHLQGALHLMDVVQAKPQARQVLRAFDECLKGLAGLLQGLRDFALDPLQGDIVVPITHSDSKH
ncbi:hypothetical protein D3C80_612860 [compost metagenome]